MISAACSGSSGEAVTEDVETEAVETTDARAPEDETAEEDSTDDADDDAAEDGDSASVDEELITIEADDGPSSTFASSAMGGVRFEVPDTHTLLVTGDQLLVSTAEGLVVGDDGVSFAAVALTSQLSSGTPIETAEEYLAAAEAADVDIVPTGTKIELLGYELVGYNMEGDKDLFTFANDRRGAPVESGFGPGENAIEFVGTTPSGVLTAIASNPGGSLDDWLPTLGTLVASIEFTGSGLDPALPDGEAIQFADEGPPPPAAEASEDPDGLPPLGEPFSPIDPGRYEFLNFGLSVSIDVPGDWFVQPNFPGVVVLTRAGSIGPGDRDIVFLNDIRELVPIGGGPIQAGDALSVDDIEAIISDPPPGAIIDNVERFDLTAPNGSATRVIAFDFTGDPSAACSLDEPCDFALVTPYGFVKKLLSTSDQRIWFFPEHPTGPAAAVAQNSQGTDFIAEASAVIATLELSR